MAMTNVYNGSNGSLFLANETGPEGDAARSVRDEYEMTDTAVGRVTDVQVCVQTDLQEYYEVGRRHPVTLHSGRISISGRIARAYINGALLALLLGEGAGPTHADEPYVQPRFTMRLSLNDPAVPNNTAVLEIRGVKLQNWSYQLPENDFVMENITFKALEISVVDTEEAQQ